MTPLRTLGIGSGLFLCLGLLAAPAQAGDLYVAGTIGEVYKGDSQEGGFKSWGGICLGPIRALAKDDTHLYAGDEAGGIIPFELATGEASTPFFAPDSITAMVVHDGDVLVSEVSGEIHRIDPATGKIESTMTGPYGVQAMLLLGDDLFASSALEGSVWKGNPVTGDFQYFGCGCAGPAQGMAHDEANLFVGDEFGQFVRYDLANGYLLDEGFFPFDISAMVRDGDDLLLSESNGTIHRINPFTHEVLATLKSPIAVEAMLMPAPHPADVNEDGAVDVDDLTIVILNWGACDDPPPAGCCLGDVNCDGVIGVDDLTAVILEWD